MGWAKLFAMGNRGSTESESTKSRAGVLTWTACVIFGVLAAFMVAALDGATSFGDASGTRFAVVFLISLPVATLLAYAALKDLKEKIGRLKEPVQPASSVINRRTIVYIVAVVIVGLLWLIFGDFTVIPGPAP